MVEWTFFECAIIQEMLNDLEDKEVRRSRTEVIALSSRERSKSVSLR